MATVIEGDFSTPAGRFAVVAARFNAVIVDALVAGALDAFRRHGVADDAVDVVRVPGSFEIPVVARRLAGSQEVRGGDLPRGGHQGRHRPLRPRRRRRDERHPAGSVATGVPVIFGVLTCDTLEQAVNRAGGKAGNKGFEAAVTAIEWPT